MPSIALSGVALKIAGPLDTWPIAPSILFAAGGFLTALSLAALGRCFALLPAVRGVVTAGPFRVVRHPAYAGELIMLAACGLSSPNRAAAIAVALVGAALLSARILAEERVLGEEPAYREYMARVRARLLPGIW